LILDPPMVHRERNTTRKLSPMTYALLKNYYWIINACELLLALKVSVK
jgi:hypothetical protein